RSMRDLVLDVEFDDEVPEAYEVLVVDNENKTQLLVESLKTGNVARCLNLRADKTLQKGMVVDGTGKSIEIPVGDQLIGRVIDAMAQPIDGQGPLDDTGMKRRNIFKSPPQSNSFKVTKPEILETGIKVIDFFTPFVKGRKIGIIGGAGVGKTVLT